MKKLYQKIVVYVLCAIAIFSGMFSINYADAAGFTDIPSTYTQLDAVNYVSDNGYMTGVGSNQFAPMTNMTRAMFVQTLYKKSLNRIPKTTAISFSDVPSTAYYYDAVCWAVANGITSGTSSTTFSPNNTIKRQDAAVMFYKFAGALGYDTSKKASLSAYTDQSNISNYALPAIKWAVYYGIINGTTSTTLSPASSITRIANAIMITAFGTNIEKLYYSYDVWKINNSSSNFTASKYYISNTHYNKLVNLVKANYSANKATYVINQINSHCYNPSVSSNPQWGGSCYGMSCIVMLSKTGKMDYVGNFTNRSKMRDVTGTDIKGKTGESAINFYHFSQFAFDDVRYTNDSLSSQLSTAYKKVKNNKGLSLLNVWWQKDSTTNGHTVVATSVTYSGGVYKYKIYDPNVSSATADQTLSVDSSGNMSLNSIGNVVLSHIGAITDVSDYTRKIDIDGYQNTAGNSTTLSLAAQNTDEQSVFEDDHYASIIVELNSDFKIIYDGNSLVWEKGKLSGDIEGVYYYLINNPNGAAYINIAIPASSEYQFIPIDSKTMNVSVADIAGFASVAGTGVESAIIDKDKFVDITGENIYCDVSINKDKSNLLPDVISCSAIEEIQATAHDGEYVVSEAKIENIEKHSDVP